MKTFQAVDGFRQHPDMVDDFYRLCLRFVQKCPGVFLQSQYCRKLLEMAINAVSIEHREANQSVTKFLTEFVELARRAVKVGKFWFRVEKKGGKRIRINLGEKCACENCCEDNSMGT